MSYLRNLRKRKGLSQRELAEEAGMSQASISRLEKHRRSLNEPIALNLGEALDIDPETLLAKFEEEESNFESVPPIQGNTIVPDPNRKSKGAEESLGEMSRDEIRDYLEQVTDQMKTLVSSVEWAQKRPKRAMNEFADVLNHIPEAWEAVSKESDSSLQKSRWMLIYRMFGVMSDFLDVLPDLLHQENPDEVEFDLEYLMLRLEELDDHLQASLRQVASEESDEEVVPEHNFKSSKPTQEEEIVI